MTQPASDNGTPAFTDEFLTDLRDIYNIDGIELMKHYGAARLQVLKPGSLMDAAIYADRVTVFVNLRNQIYAIEKG